MNEPVKEQYIISETVEEQIKVLQLLEKLGYLWQSEKKPTELVTLEERHDEQVIYLNTWYKTLSYSDGQYLEDIESPNTEKVTYEELLRQSKKVII